MDPIELAVDALAAYRITRLVTADVITEPIRHKIVRDAYQRAWRRYDATVLGDLAQDDNTLWDTVGEDFGPEDRAEGETLEDAVARDHDAPKLATLVTCRWCTGVWVAAGIVVARRVAPRAWAPVARGAALAAGAVLVAGLED